MTTVRIDLLNANKIKSILLLFKDVLNDGRIDDKIIKECRDKVDKINGEV
jgi:hypothetical protein